MPRVGDVVLVALGGSVGSVARYLVGLALAAALGVTFPYGTLVVNLTGCFAAGVALGVGDVQGLATPARLALVTGFLGGYTTFSAFGVETARLAEQQGMLIACVNVGGNVVVGIAAAALGLGLGRAY